ncbi:MAG: hypothetical protein HOM80_07935, partial [Bacteroidetes bacterium]|nr:hypothetical protein [Bacteroidota bacterium]
MRKNTLDFLKEYFPLIISLFILSTISIIHIFTNDLWIDESSSLITTEVSLLKVIQQALIWEEQAPLYYFILGIWRLISTNYMFARFLSLIFMLLSVVKIYMIIKQYEKSKLLLTLFLLFISINHNAIYSAVNIRYYSLTIFICVILICQFLKYYVSDIKPDLKEKIFFSIVATISILTQYYIGFLLLAIGGVILIHKGFKDFFRYCILMILPITVIILQCIIIFSQVETYLAYNMQGSGVLGMFKFILVKIEDNLVAFNSFPDVRWLRYLIRIVYVFVLVTAFINRGKIRHEAKYLIFLLVIMFIPLSVLYFTMGDDFICFRHTMFLYFPIILLFFFVIKPLNFNLKIIILSFILASFCTMVRGEGIFFFFAIVIIFFIKNKFSKNSFKTIIPAVGIFFLILIPILLNRIDVIGSDGIFMRAVAESGSCGIHLCNLYPEKVSELMEIYSGNQIERVI